MASGWPTRIPSNHRAPRVLADGELAAYLRRLGSLRQLNLCLSELGDDLNERVARRSMARLLGRYLDSHGRSVQ